MEATAAAGRIDAGRVEGLEAAAGVAWRRQRGGGCAGIRLRPDGNRMAA